MMKKIFLLILMSNYIFGQSHEDLKKLDTIYYIFNESKYETRTEIDKNDTLRIYQFNIKCPNLNPYDVVGFRYPKLMNQKDIFITLNKHDRFGRNFIKNHKKKIINFKVLKNFKKCEEIYSIFNNYSKTVYYIIDYNNTKNEKFYIFQVSPMIRCYFKEDKY